MVTPFRYISEVASTKTFRSSKLKVLSIMPAPFSNDMEYWNPEQPPPTTPTRNPAGIGFCCAITSFTLATAVGVKDIGLVSTLGVVVVGVVVVVAISRLLNSDAIITNRKAAHGSFTVAQK